MLKLGQENIETKFSYSDIFLIPNLLKGLTEQPNNPFSDEVSSYDALAAGYHYQNNSHFKTKMKIKALSLAEGFNIVFFSYMPSIIPKSEELCKKTFNFFKNKIAEQIQKHHDINSYPKYFEGCPSFEAGKRVGMMRNAVKWGMVYAPITAVVANYIEKL